MKGWAGIGALCWLAIAIAWLNDKHRRKRHHDTHRALRLSGRAHLDNEIDPQTYADAMLRAAKHCLGYLLALILIVFGVWLTITIFAGAR